jgi:hypothetical protein
MLRFIAIETNVNSSAYVTFLHNNASVTISTRHLRPGMILCHVTYCGASGSLEDAVYTFDHIDIRSTRRALRTILSMVG